MQFKMVKCVRTTGAAVFASVCRLKTAVLSTENSFCAALSIGNTLYHKYFSLVALMMVEKMLGIRAVSH